MSDRALGKAQSPAVYETSNLERDRDPVFKQAWPSLRFLLDSGHTGYVKTNTPQTVSSTESAVTGNKSQASSAEISGDDHQTAAEKADARTVPSRSHEAPIVAVEEIAETEALKALSRIPARRSNLQPGSLSPDALPIILFRRKAPDSVKVLGRESEAPRKKLVRLSTARHTSPAARSVTSERTKSTQRDLSIPIIGDLEEVLSDKTLEMLPMGRLQCEWIDKLLPEPENIELAEVIQDLPYRRRMRFVAKLTTAYLRNFNRLGSNSKVNPDMEAEQLVLFMKGLPYEQIAELMESKRKSVMQGLNQFPLDVRGLLDIKAEEIRSMVEEVIQLEEWHL